MRHTLGIMVATGVALLPIPSRASPRAALATPVFLLPYAEDATYIDYRPAINAAGTRIVFERQFKVQNKDAYGEAELYITDLSKPDPQRLASKTSGTARADWCWSSSGSAEGPITFSANDGVYYTAANPQAGGPATHVPNTTSGMVYPTWFPGCSNLAVYVPNAIPYGGQTGPETEKFDLAGNVLASLSGTKLWAGFPSVNQKTPSLLAIAAQQLVAAGYNQDLNYVYIANTAGKPPRVTPLDVRAPTNRYDPRFEGRAPTWSPDGRWIAFESNRNCALPASAPYYAIFIQDSRGRSPARQVTDCSYNVQHAKWYAQPVNRRTLLIATVRMHPAYTGTDPLILNARGIAALDITPITSR